MKRTVVIIDDEMDARALLKINLDRHPSLVLVGEAGDGLEAIHLINTKKPDLVLLDIQMPERDGLSVIQEVEHQPLFILLTAYDEFAIKAFELNAVDYLLKPYAPDRFDAAIERVQHRFSQGTIGPQQYQQLLQTLKGQSLAASPYLERIHYKSDTKTYYIETASIQLIEAADQYVYIYTANQKHLLRQNMDHLESVLDPKHFFRTHRSFIVPFQAVDHLDQFGPRQTWIFLKNGMKAKLSQVRKGLFLSKMEGRT